MAAPRKRTAKKPVNAIPQPERSPGDRSQVTDPCIAYKSMVQDWQLVGDLMGGTRSMRAAGRRWLPQEPKETSRAYDVRLERSTFFNGFKRAVESLAGAPFSRPVTYSEKLDKRVLKDFILDVDLNGRHMDVFLRDAFTSAMADGIRHILVDKSPKPPEERTQADQMRFNRRPYCVEIDARNLFFWRYTSIFGHPFLSEIRWKEKVTEPNGMFGETEIEQVRRMMPGQWEVWRKKSDTAQRAGDEWEIVSAGTSDLDYIPLVTIYAGRKGFMVSEPPLVDLAWENIHHWQSRSDQNHILHIARVPVWFGKGMPKTNVDGDLIEYTVSPNEMLTSEDPNADLKIIEHTGAAIQAGRDDLEDCENRMAVLGTELLRKEARNNPITATEVATDATAENSKLAMLVRGLEDSAEAILEFMGDWEGIQMPNEEFVSIFKEFIQSGRAETSTALAKMRDQSCLSKETYISEQKRIGILGPSVNVEQEMEKIANEPPDLGTLGPDLGSSSSEMSGTPPGGAGKRPSPSQKAPVRVT